MIEAGDMASPHTDEKSLPVLLEELRKLNEENSEFLERIDGFENIIEKINRIYESYSSLLPNEKPIRDWKEREISAWTSEIRKKNYKKEYLPEILAVIKQAVNCAEQFLPRDVQILSVLSLLYSKDDHGRLAQIYTGEGKSITISVLAVVKVLQGNKVDIVTSSEVLAQRDAQEKAKFYSLFGLSTAENCTGAELREKPCYRADIVYGDTLNFQADILYDEYKRYETRCGRPFDVVIVDEVDSMLIDERFRMTLLSSPTPGMSALTPVLEFIWIAVNKCYQSLLLSKDGQFKSIDPVVLIKLHLKDKIKNIEKFVQANIPQYFKEYAVTQIINWCFSAAHAIFSYKEDEHYVIRKGEIVPVDYKSTGVPQYCMHWGDGLHQFLQMKHDLKVTQINLVTNFLSNVSYFKRYGAKIFGLTGTLGSESERKLLTDLYSLDSVYIPSYRPRRLQEVTGIILHDHEPWLSSIKDSIMKETKEDRAVLVICETIKNVKHIQTKLSDYDGQLISIYIENSTEEQKRIKNKLLPRQIVLATNLAGRGTDLKLSCELETKGGLHVIVTFLPENLRVQEQAFGRAGRQGSVGTAQLIINVNDDSIRGKYSKCQTLEEIKAARDAKERKFLASAAKETEKVVNKDTLFHEFCLLMKTIKESSNNDKEVLDALEERWALWLLSLTDKNLLTQEHEELFGKFKLNILSDFHKNEIIKNPKYYLRQGHRFFDAEKYEEALKAYKIAERMNAFDWLPKYYQAIAIIKLQEQVEKPSTCALEEAVECLTDARKLCSDDVANFEGIKQFHQLQRTTVEERPKEQHSLVVDKSPIPITPVENHCERYDQLVSVKCAILNMIDKLIEEADKASKAGKIFKVKTSRADSVFNSKDSKKVIENLRADGLSKIASIDKPRPWLPIIGIGLLGISELVIGIGLCATGVGIVWGYGLIIEGSADIVTAVITYVTKDFNWKIYVGTKTASVALTLAGAGFINVGRTTVAAAGVTRVGIAVGAGMGGALYGVARSVANHYKNKSKLQERLETLIDNTGLREKLGYINEILKQFSPDDPVYIKEFDLFEQSCIKKIKEVIRTKPIRDILIYLAFIPDSKCIVEKKYTEVNETQLDSILAKTLKADPIVKEVNDANVHLFNLLEEHSVIKNIIDKLSEKLKIPELDICTPEKLVHTISQRILTSERGELEASITKANEEKAKLQSEKESLEEKKEDEKDAEKVKNIKIQLYDAFDGIESVKKELKKLEEAGREYNQKLEAITKIDPAVIIPVIESLNANVFRVEDGVPFVVLEADVAKAKKIIEAISVDCSLEILKTLFIETFKHIYDVSSSKDSMQVLPNLVVEISKTGNGSLIHIAFEKYLSKIAAANNLDIQKTIELAKVDIEKIKEEQEKKIPINISDIIGEKEIILGDGNCFFAAVAATFGLSPQRYHLALRQIAINHIKRNRESYEVLLVDSSFAEYTEIYRKPGTWNATLDGNDIMIDALAQALNLSIVIHLEQHEGITRTVNESDQEILPEIHLAYTGAHYNAYISRDLTYLKEVKKIVCAFNEEPL